MSENPDKKMSIKTKGVLGCLGLLFVLMLIAGISSITDKPTSNSTHPVPKEAPKATEANERINGNTPPPTVVPKQPEGFVTWLNEYIAKEFPRFTVTSFEGDNVATDQSGSFEAVINSKPEEFTNFLNGSACDYAKITAYDMFEGIYSHTELKGKLQRVEIIIPAHLRASLGASDGFPMTENKGWAGETNFWRVFSSYPFNSENETGAMENRTWAVLLNNCK